jgi:hypothetical protein
MSGELFTFESSAAAWQRRLREQKAREEPREGNRTLEGYRLETVGRGSALGLISEYEWLGTMGGAIYFVGLYSPQRDLEGVACFGSGPQGDIRKVIGTPALCLERGACVHYAPPNAASFLISGACRLVKRLTGVTIFYAYGDPEAGEYGAVYQAANWLYLGQGIHHGKERAKRLAVLPPGKDPAQPANWRTTRVLREPRAGRRLSFAQARALGWQIAYRDAKHVYAINIGPRRAQWRRRIGWRRYPAPRPHLKLRQLERTGVQVELIL